MATVLLLGTFDTKGDEYAFVRDRLIDAGIDVLTVDAGVLGDPASRALPVDIGPERLAQAAGRRLADLSAQHDRGGAVTAMAEGARRVVAELFDHRKFDGALALGGTGGTAIAAAALRELPLGVAKIIVSTTALGDTSAYVGESDLILMPSVADIAGLNRISTSVLTNAAAALAGMVTARPVQQGEERPLVAASMFGVTTPGVQTGRRLLEQLGYEVVVFHMTGAGGRGLESLARQGQLAGIFDLTTTELADELVGGVFSAGPVRMTGANDTKVPRVVSVGALDMVNFGPPETVPERFAARQFYQHNPQVTLMRTTPEECRVLGRILADRLVGAAGPIAVFLPLGGVSAIATPDGPFYDPDADAALFAAVRDGLAGSGIEVAEVPYDINDERLARSMVDRLDSMITQQRLHAVRREDS